MDVRIYMFNSYMQEFLISKKIPQQRAEYPFSIYKLRWMQVHLDIQVHLNKLWWTFFF
jgi:hypothetical protein